MRYLVETTRRRRRVPPWYVWCAGLGALVSLARIALGEPWASLILPAVAITVAVGGWLYSPSRLSPAPRRELQSTGRRETAQSRS